MNKAKKVLWGLVIVAVLALGVLLGLSALARFSRMKPFKEHMATYLREPSVLLAGAPGEVPDIRIGGKMITVDLTDREPDWLYFKLPAELRAKSPEEVSTVVQLKWDKVQVGTYTNNRPAYRQTCMVRVVDRERNVVLQQSSFEGSDPPYKISSSVSEGSSDKPTDEIVNWLKSLPRR